MHGILLVLHIAAGSAGLLLGALALALPKRPGWNPSVARAYLIAVTAVNASAIGLVVLRPALWVLSIIAMATQAAVHCGYLLARRQRPRWARRSVRLLGVSYISLVTALVVVSVPVPILWVVPTLAGEPLVRRAARSAGSRETNRDLEEWRNHEHLSGRMEHRARR